jgi:hypothetical protein
MKREPRRIEPKSLGMTYKRRLTRELLELPKHPKEMLAKRRMAPLSPSLPHSKSWGQ